MTNPTLRTVARVVDGEHKLEGGGFLVRRPFPTHALDHVDPFLLLDEAGPIQPKSDGDMNDHPHRGFETLTYVLSGQLFSHDSSGFEDVFHTGDVEWTTAGSGIVHGGAALEAGGPARGIQLWVNLPREQKMIAPKSARIAAASIPKIVNRTQHYEVNVLAGNAEGTEGPVQTTWPILYLHYKIDAGGNISLAVPQKHNIMVYVLRGNISLGEDHLEEGQLGILTEGDLVEIANAAIPAEILVLGGAPIGEPVARYGPFVMNTRDEVFQAFDDFRAGKFPMPKAPATV